MVADPSKSMVLYHITHILLTSYHNSRSSASKTEQVPAIVANHYHVRRCIGEGSFGVIYEGESDLNGRLVAIKLVHRQCVLIVIVGVAEDDGTAAA
jgi:serine/threonine protein kinase